MPSCDLTRVILETYKKIRNSERRVTEPTGMINHNSSESVNNTIITIIHNQDK